MSSGNQGLFEGVEVELGPRQDDFYPVLDGADAGDRVAAAGGFLVDAETRLNPAAASTYFGASGAPQSSRSTAAGQRPSRQPHRKAVPPRDQRETWRPRGSPPTISKTSDQFRQADRPLAIAQRVCPMTGTRWAQSACQSRSRSAGQPVFSAARDASPRPSGPRGKTLN